MTTIDAATIEDLPALVDIYNHSVQTSNSNFDTQPASVDAWQARFDRYSPTGPHRLLVARHAGTVVGYASSGRFRDHDAFRETVEVSVSLHHDHRGRGIGTMLYSSLFQCLGGEPVHVAVAGIALPNETSIALHRKFGFTEVGTFREYAIKHGQYISSVWMQRLLVPENLAHAGTPL